MQRPQLGCGIPTAPYGVGRPTTKQVLPGGVAGSPQPRGVPTSPPVGLRSAPASQHGLPDALHRAALGSSPAVDRRPMKCLANLSGGRLDPDSQASSPARPPPTARSFASAPPASTKTSHCRHQPRLAESREGLQAAPPSSTVDPGQQRAKASWPRRTSPTPRPAPLTVAAIRTRKEESARGTEFPAQISAHMEESLQPEPVIGAAPARACRSDMRPQGCVSPLTIVRPR
jgi:hypothetical protein